MKLEACHELLAMGADFEAAQGMVRRFFARTQLVRYDSVRIDTPACLNGTDVAFQGRIEQGLAANRQALVELASELKESGVASLDDVLELPQGFQSKLVHTIAHLLDGFFGIDTCFYNLVDDSHWLTETTREEMKGAPGNFWLLRAIGVFTVVSREKAVLLRTFEQPG